MRENEGSVLTRLNIRAPYLVLIGDVPDPTYAKTGFGLVDWCPERVLGQFRLPGCGTDLGVPELTLEAAVAAGAASLVVGVAPAGGQIPDHWWQVLAQAAELGLDVVSGLHQRLIENEELLAAAQRSGARLVDVRVPPGELPIATGLRRSGRRLLCVGTDCAVGKKYTALALHRAMNASGLHTTFRATGQTGIMISGEGIPLDAVIADFAAGAVEYLSPASTANHWDIIEGQGSLFHPAYSGISLSLLHGAQPDAFVVAHEPARTKLSGWEAFETPSLEACIALHVELGKRLNPGIRCVGVSINSSGLEATERSRYLAETSEKTGLPCVDVMRDSAEAIVDRLLEEFPEPRQ